MAELSVYDNDPTLYLFTSLTAGSSHIVTATSRIETILKANKIPFKGVDTATDELARKLYGRRARGKKLPLLVKEGYVIADLEQIEEWNEYDELKDVLGGPAAPAPVAAAKAAPATAASASDKKENEPSANAEQNLAIRQLGAEAAKVAAAKKHVPENISTTNPRLTEKINSPAVSTPTKKADPSGILSPRAIPLPATPNPAVSSPTSSQPTASTPKISSKPAQSPPTTHTDAAKSSLAAAPTSTTASSSEEEDGEDEEEVVDKAGKAPVKEVSKPDGKDDKEVGKAPGQSKEAAESEEESDEESDEESEEESDGENEK